MEPSLDTVCGNCGKSYGIHLHTDASCPLDGGYYSDVRKFTVMQDFTVGAQIDGLIEDLEGAYEDLQASDARACAAFDAYEVAKKRMTEDAAKVAELREKLAQIYPVTKGMVWDHALAEAKECRRYNKEHGA